jgi:signal transduction histidine kinase
MTRLYSLPIRMLLFLIVFVVALPAAGIIVYTGIKLRKEAFDQACKDTQRVVESIEIEHQHLVSGAEQLMTAIAQLPEVKQHDGARTVPILRELRNLNPIYSNITIADRDGTVWATAVPVTGPYNIANRRYFRNALASGQLSSGEYGIGRATSKPVFHFGQPLKDDHGSVIGVVSVGFVLDRYRDLLSRLQLPAGTNAVLLDHQGKIMSRAVNPERFIGKEYSPEVFKELQEGPETGTSIRAGLEGDKRIISYRKVHLKDEQAPYLYITSGIPMEVLLRRAHQTIVQNVLLFTSFLAAALFLAWRIGKRSIVDRLTLLEQASRRLARGEPDVRVSGLVAGGELGSLGEAFDTMARELAARGARLQQQTQALTASNRELESFSYTLSHDLRSPLTRIYTAGQALAEMYDGVLDENGRMFVHTICESSEQMEELIEAILGLSGVIGTEMHMEDVDLSSLTETIAAELRLTEPERKVTFVIAPGVTAFCDPRLMRVVLENLVGNAWKYSRKTPVARIEFGTAERDGKPVYYVRDNGAGFDMKDMDKLFAPFKRLHASSDFPGTGIGLATVRRVIKRHGGEVWAEGEPGKGATFYFTL